MLILDIRDGIIHRYTCEDTVQKATVYQQWHEYKHQISDSHHDKIITLFDEQCFLRYHISVEFVAETPFTRSHYKQLIHEKTKKVQSELWVRPELIHVLVKNIKNNGISKEYMIGERGALTFDLCFYILDQWYADVLQMNAITWYPRRFFLMQHEAMKSTPDASLLVIEPYQTSLVQTQQWRYHRIFSLNGGDDLLRQAYEEVWLDPYSDQERDFEANTLWAKLLLDAHHEFSDLMMQWLATHLDQGQDLYLISRLIDQPYFIQKIGEAYTSTFQGRLIPYRGYHKDIWSRVWTNDELPVQMVVEHFLK